ncbi:MAG: exo-alpha-sialidase [Limnochordia bacterium]|nr:exo-alpha-sialidase [Limnochordia bacterium]
MKSNSVSNCFVSPITNCWGEKEQIQINTECRLVFRGSKGAAFNHHPQITAAFGRLYATWSCGDLDEDDVGQRMVMSVSEDGGVTWTTPCTIVERANAEYASAVITNGGIRVFQDQLIAYYGYYEFTRAGLADGRRQQKGAGEAPVDQWWHQNTYCGAMVSDDSGVTWKDQGIVVDRFVPNWGPHLTSTGRLIMPGNLWFPYTDDPVGTNPWYVTGLPRLPDWYVDDPEGFHRGCRYRGDAREYCEGSFFETDDGVLHMMLRTNQNRLAVSTSHDHGQTWSEPCMTSFVDDNSKHMFGRLPDGRFYGLSTPKPNSGRTPLVMALSEDGVVFDRHFLLGSEPCGVPRMEGLHKGGRYGYPHLIMVEGIGFVIYSVFKEDIVVCRFPLNALK